MAWTNMSCVLGMLAFSNYIGLPHSLVRSSSHNLPILTVYIIYDYCIGMYGHPLTLTLTLMLTLDLTP